VTEDTPEATEEFLTTFADLFINRWDSYAIQQKNGQYSRVQQSLSLEILRQHLKGEITVGSYQLDCDGMVKTLIFDFDPEKLENPKEAVMKVLATCFEEKKEEPRIWKKAILLEASRYPNPSYHIWLFFWLPVQAKVAQWLGYRILELAGLNPKLVEVFPKQTALTADRPYGNFVKLPLGKHQACGRWSRFLDLETFEPLPSNCLSEVQGLNFSERTVQKILSFEEQKHIQIKLTTPSKQINLEGKEEIRIVNFLAKYWKPGRRNQLELYFLGWAMKKGITYESALRIIDAVIIATQDEEKQARLDLVKYHYRTRGSMLPELKGITGLREIVRGL